jgi:hypothetical protein
MSQKSKKSQKPHKSRHRARGKRLSDEINPSAEVTSIKNKQTNKQKTTNGHANTNTPKGGNGPLHSLHDGRQNERTLLPQNGLLDFFTNEAQSQHSGDFAEWGGGRGRHQTQEILTQNKTKISKPLSRVPSGMGMRP